MSVPISANVGCLKIFSNVKYFVTGTLPENVKRILSEGGAEKINFFSDMVTHCIVGEQPRENDISDAKELYEVPAVSVYWVLLSAYCNKSLPTKGFVYDRTQIFSNLVVTASQLTSADFKAIWAMITFYGGKFKSVFDKSCTHLICGKPVGKKYEAALNENNVKIVTPDWIGECIKFGSKVEEDFFHPKYLLFPKAKDNSPSASGDLSTAQILGFADDITPSVPSLEPPSSASSTQALLEKLKQRMPWNRPSSSVATTPSSPTHGSFSQSPYGSLQTNKMVPPPQSNQMQPPLQSVINETQSSQSGQSSQLSSQQGERIAIDQQPRMQQQGQPWRPNTIQTVRPQYTLIQRDGSVVQAQATNWTQYHLQQQQQQQQQRLQPQNSSQSGQIIQQSSHPTQSNPAVQHPKIQQVPLLSNSQSQGPLPVSGTGPIQALNPPQRQITWTQQPQLQGPPKQVIQLDPQTHAQLSQMDPHQRTLFLQKIQRQRQIILQQRQLQLQQQQQQQQHQQRPVNQGGKLGNSQSSHPAQQLPGQQQQQQQQQQPSTIPIRQQQIIIRGVMPPGLTPQQQAVWLHQQQFIRQQQILVQQQTNQIRHPANASPSRIVQQQTATSTWIPQTDSQQQQQQLQMQRQQQMRIQQLQIQKQQQIVVQRTAPQVPQQVFQQTSSQQNLTGPNMSQALHADDPPIHNQVGGSTGGGLLVNNRTKTALANMLSSRLQTGHLSPQTQNHGQGDGSAAGQLRMMSAQQRTPQPPPPPAPSTQLTDTQPGSYGQQPRRSIGNVDASGSGARSNIPSREISSTGTPVSGPKSANRATLASGPSSAPSAMSQKPQFFAHNPSLRIPPDKYFLGCAFYIVEYDRSEDNNLSAWEEIIRDHGGEIETIYTHRVTHILCETQKHGIVQQALRDGKRCITAFWLNDVVSKGSLSVPWQALHFPVPFGKEKPLSKYHMTLTGFEDKCERDRVATMIRVAGGQYRNYLSPLTHIVVCRKAEGAKYKKAKETNKVTVNVQWLNEVLFGHYSCIQQPEAHKYQQFNSSTCFRVDYSLIPHLMGAWKLPINVTSEAYNAVKNSSPSPRKTKKLRIDQTLEQRRELETKILDSVQIIQGENGSADNQPFIMVTGDKNLEVTKKGKEMGCALAGANTKVTHLVVCGKPSRTFKMLKCLILARYIVKDTWLVDSYNNNKLLSESSYSIHQADSEDFKCNISKVLSSPERCNLFKDKIFYLTPNVEPSRRALGELVELSGGRVEKQRRSVKAIQELNKVTQTYIVIACYDDLALIADIFRAKLEFYTAEFIMKSITTQSIDYAASAYRY